MEQLVGRLRRADFGCVDAGADGEHDLVRRPHLPRLIGRQRPRIRQTTIGGANPLEILDVLRRADDRGDRAAAFGGGAQLNNLYAVGAGGDELEVGFDGLCRRQAAIGAHPEAEVGLGRGSLGPGRSDERSVARRLPTAAPSSRRRLNAFGMGTGRMACLPAGGKRRHDSRDLSQAFSSSRSCCG